MSTVSIGDKEIDIMCPDCYGNFDITILQNAFTEKVAVAVRCSHGCGRVGRRLIGYPLRYEAMRDLVVEIRGVVDV